MFCTLFFLSLLDAENVLSGLFPTHVPEMGSSSGTVLCSVESPRDSAMFRMTWESPLSTRHGGKAEKVEEVKES